jgi:GTP 3',8-cyclase
LHAREVFGRDYASLARSDLLSFEEITRLVRVFAQHGVSKVRLTGGEPLLRRGLVRLIEMIASIEGIADVALTTNGSALAARAQTLRSAGLSRVTVSLDALDDETFGATNDVRFPVARVLAGIEAAAAAGLAPVKVNMVVKRSVNDQSIVPMAEYFRDSGHILRFIEYMDVGTTNGWRLSEVVCAAEILAALRARWPLERLPANYVEGTLGPDGPCTPDVGAARAMCVPDHSPSVVFLPAPEAAVGRVTFQARGADASDPGPRC